MYTEGWITRKINVKEKQRLIESGRELKRQNIKYKNISEKFSDRIYRKRK